MRPPAPVYIETVVDGVAMSIEELKDIIIKAAEYGAGKNANLPDYYSLNQSYKIYGRKTVDEWISGHIVTVRQTGRNYRLRRGELEKAAIINRRQMRRVQVKELQKVETH